MRESAGAYVDTHVHPHTSELTKEELETKRQAAAAQEEEDERRRDEEGKKGSGIYTGERGAIESSDKIS